MKIISKTVKASIEIPFTFFQQEKKADTLAIILPGAGYTAQAPLLHYTAGSFFTRGIDVLQVNYKYPKALSDETFTEDVQTVVNSVLSEHHYDYYYIAAKSIGTIALSGLLKNPIFDSANLIWFTPLISEDFVYQALMKAGNKGQVYIGTEDPNYSPERFDVLNKKENLDCYLIEDVNHSIEKSNDVIQSIDILKGIMEKVSAF
ncbi:alpha/beta hydrolase [Neobacillus terrae]|uniref:alpha/beta hydrolase n=1 Tax=Neobacillus terrae TaxID=3034837 RepID=UPI00140C2989|nr:alpha/beta hydrolase [Neobacillus terrae]NHM33528.1 alpha/beta hydrolase [Neobacillus terrae]